MQTFVTTTAEYLWQRVIQLEFLIYFSLKMLDRFF